MSLTDSFRRISTGTRRLMRRKVRQINRLSRKSLQMLLLLGGAGLVALMSLGFAYLADKALDWNREWVGHSGWLALLVLPFSLAGLRWLTLRFAPNASGSGIPQVIGALPFGRFRWLSSACWPAHRSAGKGRRYKWAPR
ncbi:hypothetical protein G6F31_019425 [Rhizopus arrhizus]|nr:hypothetical protein G6F31_019425 [Rhizopus arrhizus]